MLEQALLFDSTGLRTLGHIHLHLRILPGQQRRFSIWLIQPLRAGDFVIMATAQAVLNGETITSESAGELIKVRSDCAPKRAHG